MAVVLLIRHGQASFGSADYDQLSAHGVEQGRLLGADLAAAGVRVDRVVAGSMRRHQQTAQAAIEGAGWGLEIQTDARWNEFDHEQVLAVHGAPADPAEGLERRAFQRWFDVATRRWSGGAHDHDYTESFAGFNQRVTAAFEDLPVDSRETVAVFTSGGVVAWLASTLLAGGPEQWHALNNVMVNSSVSKVILGRSGRSLVTFNEHRHLAPDAVTYR